MEEKVKVLYLDSWNNVGNLLREEREKVEGLDNLSLYKNNSLLNKIFRWLGMKIFQPLLYFSYGNWKKNIKKYDVIILESRKTFEYAIKYIKKHSNKRIIVWYWNEVTERELNPSVVMQKYNCEVVSFDKKDAEKYNMKFNDTYYFSTIELPKNKIENDVFYIGIDREGRIEKLAELEEYLKLNNFAYNFNLTTSPIKTPDPNYSYKPRMEYKEVIEQISKSKVILDLTKKTQYGLTLRPVEAMFFKKKLITDNKNIVDYPFYNKNNIFIIGIDDYNTLGEFIRTDYDEINPQIIEWYDFKNWLDRIIKNKYGEKYEWKK